jgi:hypothetical protein
MYRSISLVELSSSKFHDVLMLQHLGFLTVTCVFSCNLYLSILLLRW